MPLRKNFDKKAILNKIENNDRIGEYAAETVHKYVSPYTPYNTGRLCNDVTYKPYKLIYNAPYAEETYNNMKMNFPKDKHPLATAKWVEVAMPAVRDYIIQDLQDFIDGMDLNG